MKGHIREVIPHAMPAKDRPEDCLEPPWEVIHRLVAERDEARAEAAKLRVEVDQLKAYGRGMTEECKKLREERDAVVIEPGVKAFATGIGDSEDSTIQFEDTPVHVVERKRKGWWYVQKLNGELFLVHEKNLVRRREEKGGE